MLVRFQLTPGLLGVDSSRPSVSPFRLPHTQAAAGKTTPLMRQVGLIASCTDAAALSAISQTGKMGDEHGVSATDIGACAALWLREHIGRLCAGAAQAKGFHSRLVTRLRRGERERLLQWHQALASKHALPAELVAEVEEASKAAAAASTKAIKKASKKAAAAAREIT